MKCQNCGRECLDDGRSLYCAPCELELKDAEPPQFLKDMRAVYEGRFASATGPGHRMLQQMMQEDPAAFLNQLRSAEKEYRAGMREKEEKVKEATVDEGSKRVEELIQKILASIVAEEARAEKKP